MTSTDDLPATAARAAWAAAVSTGLGWRTGLSRHAGVSRRGVLTAGAIGVAGVALAACSQAATPDDPTVNGQAGSATGGAGSGSTGGAGSGSSGGAGQPLAQLSAIPVGSAISATGPDGAALIIARPTSGTVAAFSAVCTHQGCTVAPAGNQLDCPCHGSAFDAITGAVLSGPASLPLRSVRVMLSGDNVLPA